MSKSSGGTPEPLENPILYYVCLGSGLDQMGRTVRKSFLLCMFGGWAGFGGKGLKFESFTFSFFSNKSLPQLQRILSFPVYVWGLGWIWGKRVEI